MDISETGEWVVAAARGDLDLATAPRAASALARLPAGASHVVLDLSGVDLVDATGLGLLVGLRSRLAEEGGRLVLCCPAPLRDRLVRSGLAGAFEIAESVDAVLGQPVPGEGRG